MKTTCDYDDALLLIERLKCKETKITFQEHLVVEDHYQVILDSAWLIITPQFLKAPMINPKHIVEVVM
ncbi:hypothetical protein L484_020758 [Morus notabilis]|uniref:Uncharacterized protein n=1 Tax=Morus notabilis TaxID=981085 RepID=W9SJG7_9ROSA|nr:hypothetical protein L484_020758 [Morus notabilis]